MFIIPSIIWKFLVLTIQESRQGQGNSTSKFWIEVTESVEHKKLNSNLVNGWCLSLLLSLDFAHEQLYARSNRQWLFLFTAKEEIPENRSAKRYPQESPPYTAPLSPKLPRNDAHPSEGNYVMSELYMRIIYGFSISVKKDNICVWFVSSLWQVRVEEC